MEVVVDLMIELIAAVVETFLEEKLEYRPKWMRVLAYALIVVVGIGIAVLVAVLLTS